MNLSLKMSCARVKQDLNFWMVSLIAVSIVGLASGAMAQVRKTIKLDGSSTVQPLSLALAEKFQETKKGAVVLTVATSGTGGGFKKFCRGESDIQNASRPIQSKGKTGEKSEMDSCKEGKIDYIEIPVAYDAIVVAVNPKNKFLSEITIADLKKIWAPGADGKPSAIKTWQDVNPKWPAKEIKLFGAGSDSGTFDYFTEAIVGTAKSSRKDYTPAEDDNVLVNGISTEENSMGYIPFAYYSANKDKLKALAIIGGEKSQMKDKGVLPDPKAIETGAYYPLSRPVFIYVSTMAMKRPEVKEFVDYYISNVAETAKEENYVALPAEAYKLGQERVGQTKTGTIFGGHSEVGLSIVDLLKKENKM